MVSLLTSGVNRLPRIIVARLEHVCLTRKMFGIICCQRTCILGIIEQHAQFSDNHHLTLVSGYVRVSFLVALKAWSEIACHMSAGFHLGFTRWIGVSCSRLYRVLQVQLCVPIGFACARRIVTCGPIRVVQLVYSYCSMFFAFLIVRQLAVLMFMFLFISMCVSRDESWLLVVFVVAMPVSVSCSMFFDILSFLLHWDQPSVFVLCSLFLRNKSQFMVAWSRFVWCKAIWLVVVYFMIVFMVL